MITQRITTSQTAICGSIFVADTSTYGASPDLRSEYGIAIFMNTRTGTGLFVNNPSYTDLSNPGNDTDRGEWTIDIPNTVTQDYQVVAFWCPIWVSGAYNEGDIVFYDTNFYYKNSTGTGTEIPDVGNEWDLLDENDYALFVAAALLASPIVLQQDSFEAVIGCPPYMTVLKECNGVHRLIDNSDSSNAKRFYITTYDNTIILPTTSLNAPFLDFQLPKDNVYILTVEEEINAVWQPVMKIAVYEYCKIKECAVALIQNLLSKSFDPCCENCDEEIQASMKKQQFILNQFLFLYGTLLSYINEEKIEFLGLNDISAQRAQYLQKIEDLFFKIEKILERCDLCIGAWQTTRQYSTASSNYKPCNC